MKLRLGLRTPRHQRSARVSGETTEAADSMRMGAKALSGYSLYYLIRVCYSAAHARESQRHSPEYKTGRSYAWGY